MFKLNAARTYWYPVSCTVYEGEKEVSGKFKAEFRALSTQELKEPENAQRPLLDLVLVGVKDIEVSDAEGQILTGEELLTVVKSDPATSMALVNAYQESVAKKNQRRI